MKNWIIGLFARVFKRLPAHLAKGRAGEQAARRFLEKAGMKYLSANFRSKRGEIDLIFRDADCLVFVEVKTRAPGGWNRPSRAVDREKRRKLNGAALDYLRLLKDRRVKIRFDIVEVLMEEGTESEIRHLPGAVNLPKEVIW